MAIQRVTVIDFDKAQVFFTEFGTSGRYQYRLAEGTAQNTFPYGEWIVIPQADITLDSSSGWQTFTISGLTAFSRYRIQLGEFRTSPFDTFEETFTVNPLSGVSRNTSGLVPLTPTSIAVQWSLFSNLHRYRIITRKRVNGVLVDEVFSDDFRGPSNGLRVMSNRRFSPDPFEPNTQYFFYVQIRSGGEWVGPRDAGDRTYIGQVTTPSVGNNDFTFVVNDSQSITITPPNIEKAYHRATITDPTGLVSEMSFLFFQPITIDNLRPNSRFNLSLDTIFLLSEDRTIHIQDDTFTTPVFNPITPTNLSVSRTANNSLNISFDETRLSTGYQYRIGTETGTYGEWTDLTKKQTDGSYLITDLDDETTYYLQVRSVITGTLGSNYSSPTTEASLETLPVRLEAPDAPKVITRSRNSFVVTFTSVERANKYQYRIGTSETTLGNWEDLTEDSTPGNYLITGLNPETAYYIQVRAVLTFEMVDLPGSESITFNSRTRIAIIEKFNPSRITELNFPYTYGDWSIYRTLNSDGSLPDSGGTNFVIYSGRYIYALMINETTKKCEIWRWDHLGVRQSFYVRPQGLDMAEKSEFTIEVKYKDPKSDDAYQHMAFGAGFESGVTFNIEQPAAAFGGTVPTGESHHDVILLLKTVQKLNKQQFPIGRKRAITYSLIDIHQWYNYELGKIIREGVFINENEIDGDYSLGDFFDYPDDVELKNNIVGCGDYLKVGDTNYIYRPGSIHRYEEIGEFPVDQLTSMAFSRSGIMVAFNLIDSNIQIVNFSDSFKENETKSIDINVVDDGNPLKGLTISSMSMYDNPIVHTFETSDALSDERRFYNGDAYGITPMIYDRVKQKIFFIDRPHRPEITIPEPYFGTTEDNPILNASHAYSFDFELPDGFEVYTPVDDNIPDFNSGYLVCSNQENIFALLYNPTTKEVKASSWDYIGSRTDLDHLNITNYDPNVRGSYIGLAAEPNGLIVFRDYIPDVAIQHYDLDTGTKSLSGMDAGYDSFQSLNKTTNRLNFSAYWDNEQERLYTLIGTNYGEVALTGQGLRAKNERDKKNLLFLHGLELHSYHKSMAARQVEILKKPGEYDIYEETIRNIAQPKYYIEHTAFTNIYKINDIVIDFDKVLSGPLENGSVDAIGRMGNYLWIYDKNNRKIHFLSVDFQEKPPRAEFYEWRLALNGQFMEVKSLGFSGFFGHYRLSFKDIPEYSYPKSLERQIKSKYLIEHNRPGGGRFLPFCSPLIGGEVPKHGLSLNFARIRHVMGRINNPKKIPQLYLGYRSGSDTRGGIPIGEPTFLTGWPFRDFGGNPFNSGFLGDPLGTYCENLKRDIRGELTTGQYPGFPGGPIDIDQDRQLTTDLEILSPTNVNTHFPLGLPTPDPVTPIVPRTPEVPPIITPPDTPRKDVKPIDTTPIVPKKPVDETGAVIEDPREPIRPGEIRLGRPQYRHFQKQQEFFDIIGSSISDIKVLNIPGIRQTTIDTLYGFEIPENVEIFEDLDDHISIMLKFPVQGLEEDDRLFIHQGDPSDLPSRLPGTDVWVIKSILYVGKNSQQILICQTI